VRNRNLDSGPVKMRSVQWLKYVFLWSAAVVPEMLKSTVDFPADRASRMLSEEIFI
jgi:hypothetical protein